MWDMKPISFSDTEAAAALLPLACRERTALPLVQQLSMRSHLGGGCEAQSDTRMECGAVALFRPHYQTLCHIVAHVNRGSAAPRPAATPPVREKVLVAATAAAAASNPDILQGARSQLRGTPIPMVLSHGAERGP